MLLVAIVLCAPFLSRLKTAIEPIDSSNCSCLWLKMLESSLCRLPVGACEECGPLEVSRENKAQRATRLHKYNKQPYISAYIHVYMYVWFSLCGNIKTSTTTNGDNNGAGGAPGKWLIMRQAAGGGRCGVRRGTLGQTELTGSRSGRSGQQPH